MFVRDITERKAAEVDLQVAKGKAESASQAKSAFLASMSHELRTPLNAIIGFSEVIKDEMFGPTERIKYSSYAEDIYSSGQHLLALINDILDLSKVESGAAELHEESIYIPDLVKSALTMVEHGARTGEVALVLDISDDLPLLWADERKLKQILVNLLANAVKFTEAGGVITFRAWCRANSGFVFQVVDTGIGMAASDIPKALSKFGRIDSVLSRKYEGTGLGLSLSKALIELHGGSLDLQSEVGVGTTVTVRLPTNRIIQSELQSAARETA
jgi:signal transduction histidine kinase